MINQPKKVHPTTIIISHLDCEEPQSTIEEIMAAFGTVVSKPEEILFSEDAPKILINKGTGKFKVDVQINKRPPEILAAYGNRITLSFKGVIKTCFKCFGQGHTINVCKKEKASWTKYLQYLKEDLKMGQECTGISDLPSTTSVDTNHQEEAEENQLESENENDKTVIELTRPDKTNEKSESADVASRKSAHDLTIIDNHPLQASATSTPQKIAPLKMSTLIKDAKDRNATNERPLKNSKASQHEEVHKKTFHQ